MEHPDSISTAATEDAVEADKVLEIMASKMDATSHLREDYEEFINLHANFEESTSPSSVKFENSTLMVLASNPKIVLANLKILPPKSFSIQLLGAPAQVNAAATFLTWHKPEETQVIDSSQYVRLDRPDVYRPNLQHITIDITSYERWRRIAVAQGLFTDSQIANFLTQHYENTVNGVPIPPRCISCNTPLSLTCIKCSLLQQTDFTESADLVLHADVASTDTTPPTVTVVANDSGLQHSIHDSGNSILQSGNSVTNGNLLETSIPVVSILQPSSSVADDSMLQTAIPVVNILSSTTSVPNGNTLQGSGPAVSGNSLQQSITISEGSLETLSSSITNSSDIVEEIKNVVLTLPLYECNSNSTGSFPSSSLLSTPNSSLSSLTPVLTSSSMPVLNEALHDSSASSKGHLSMNKVKKENRLKGKKELSCKECGCQVAHAFPTKASPLKKRKVFRAEKPYKCSECDAVFSHTRNMKAHFWKNHSPSGKRFSCSYCEKTFLNSRDLRTHTYRHTGEMPYKCSYCTAAFTLACNLKTHLRVHTGERPFKCKVCGKAFTESGALKVHTRKHTGEKPFKCSQCEMAFPSSGNLSRHILTHTGEKPYKCQHCSSAFSQPGSLKTHIRTHTGERPYKCKDCGAAFSDNSTLWKHKRKQSCQGMAPARNKAMTLVQAPPMVPIALLTTTTLPTTVSATPSEENQLSQQMSYRPTALNNAAFVNTINWCFSLPQP